MNTQPYKMVVIRDEDKLEALAECMEDGNATTVRTSAATVIVCADQGWLLLRLVTSRSCQVGR